MAQSNPSDVGAALPSEEEVQGMIEEYNAAPVTDCAFGFPGESDSCFDSVTGRPKAQMRSRPASEIPYARRQSFLGRPGFASRPGYANRGVQSVLTPNETVIQSDQQGESQ